MKRTLFVSAVITALITLFVACGSEDSENTSTPAGDTTAADGAPSDAGAAGDSTGQDVAPGTADFVAQGSVMQVFVTHAQPKDLLELRDSADAIVAEGEADHLGSYVFRKVKPGDGYRVVLKGSDPKRYSAAVRVMGIQESQPSQDFYAKQKIVAGTGYITMRDGTTFSYFATLPGKVEDGPYPTIVNYSGYDPSRPGEQIVPDKQKFYCDIVPVVCDAPSDPSALMAAVTGYATVSVNMRGTGCSGGAYDYFETLQLLDGYDIIEIVAAQPWVKHHKVGMVGLSYPGITQLFTAKMRPPSLAAIAPLSVIGNTATTLVPGGILNNGFALSWIDHVYKRAAPYGQGWEKKKVEAGDHICEENQLLHDQRVNNVEQAKDMDYYVSDIIDPLNPTAFVDKIKVPVFLAGAWEDEQTGPYFTTLLDKFTGSPSRRFVVYNGVHTDGFAPQVLAEWKAFLDLYVAHTKPSLGTILGMLVPQMTQTVYGVDMKLPPDRWKEIKTYEEAKAKWESEPEILVFFENGSLEPLGSPRGNFSASFEQWPPKATQAKRWYFEPEGSLGVDLPAEGTEASSFRLDPKAGGRGILAKGSKLWSTLPKYNWRAPKKGDVVSFASAPLEKDVVMMGTGSVDLWIRAPAGIKDADIEVNLSELRPDGQERYVQSGWLRASFRKLASWATELWPEPSLKAADIEPLVPEQWTKVRVAIPGFAYVFRKGSRVRIAIDTPGDSRADWRFELLTFPKEVRYDIGHSQKHASSVVLPLLPDQKVPDTAKMPPCPSLRGQQCRKYVAVPNTPATL